MEKKLTNLDPFVNDSEDTFIDASSEEEEEREGERETKKCMSLTL